jgi:hypothetical protein
VSVYLQRESAHALPASQRQLITLILRKLLASSTYAISGTLAGMVQRLEGAAAAATGVDAPPAELRNDVETLDELADEWDGEDSDGAEPQNKRPSPEELAGLRRELDELKRFHALATSIIKNSKGEVPLRPEVRRSGGQLRQQGERS